MDDRKRNDPDSLAPIELERLSAEEEALVSGMGKNKVWSLLAFAGIAAVVVLGGGVWMRDIDVKKQFADAGQAIDTLSRANLDAFAHCAFPGAPVSELEGDDTLRAALEGFSARHRSGYASKLRKCSRSLAALGDGLAAVQTPAPLDARRSELQKATAQLLAAVERYAGYLEAGEGYEVATAQPGIEGIALAWQTYRTHHAELSRTAHEHGD